MADDGGRPDICREFTCCDPLNTLGRVLDEARRLGLAVGALELRETEMGRYRLCLTLLEPDPSRARLFWLRLDHHLDLERLNS